MGRSWQRVAAFVRDREARDLVVLLGAVVAVAGAWVFGELWSALGDRDVHALDRAVLATLRSDGALRDPVGPAWLEDMVRDVTALGSTAVLSLATATVAGFLVLRGQRRAVVLLLVAVLGGTAASYALKGVIARPRPEHVVVDVVYTTSFPSGHAMVSAVVYLTLAVLAARLVEPMRVKVYLLSVALVLAFLVGASRVYLGVHHATDVLAGWAAGLAWAMLCWLVARSLQARGRVERPGEHR